MSYIIHLPIRTLHFKEILHRSHSGDLLPLYLDHLNRAWKFTNLNLYPPFFFFLGGNYNLYNILSILT